MLALLTSPDAQHKAGRSTEHRCVCARARTGQRGRAARPAGRGHGRDSFPLTVIQVGLDVGAIRGMEGGAVEVEGRVLRAAVATWPEKSEAGASQQIPSPSATKDSGARQDTPSPAQPRQAEPVDPGRQRAQADPWNLPSEAWRGVGDDVA